MNPAHRDGWAARPPPGPGAPTHHMESEQQQGQQQGQHRRSSPPYGAQTSPHGLPGAVTQAPSHYGHYQQAPHNLPPLGAVGQGSPRNLIASQQPPQSQLPPGSRHPAAYPPAPESRPTYLDRHDVREREAREVQIKEEQDAARRERDMRDRQIMPDQMQPQQHSQAGPLQIHQPIAVGPRTVHGPNGLLGNPAAAAGPPMQQLGGPHAGPGSQAQYAGHAPAAPAPPLQNAPLAASQQQPAYLAPSHATTTAAAATPSQAPAPPPPGQAAPNPQPPSALPSSREQAQGQQPILNDALSYLDQVKIQFHESPDVYNRFLDIMKDFKSGAIDTPGVIDRVSGLFAGNPDLIQGFNTFLPPGYRIEAGTLDDPNAIRVTTPLGNTVLALPGGQRLANGTWSSSAQGQSLLYSPSGRPLGPNTVSAQLAAQAASAQASADAMQASQTANADTKDLAEVDDKKEPVEFNHAINYVNKIKNRFASQPDIYKSFLDILQTYQRESRPIQEVYNQVTKLFEAAPDLLDDFKQFLPDTTQKKDKEKARRRKRERERDGTVATSSMRNEPASATQLQKTPRADRLPPVGNFAPTPLRQNEKRKRGDTKSGANGVGGLLAEGIKPLEPGPVNGVKRAKHGSESQGVRENPLSPTLIPRLPEPLPPSSGMRTTASDSELAFFDRVKKTISNKNTMNEFLKLCNLFSQDLIDKSTLVYRARSFIGGNPELFTWFQNWLGYTDDDLVVVELRSRPPTGRVMLSNCRGLGPSYRLLPKRERQKPCSGRDELCHAVLNDDWASHPTWASEDSGFIAHRKNVHEEGLHKIEEERHDYDFHIEACSRTVQLLEPFAQQLLHMDERDRMRMEIPPGIGGQSESIHKRIIKKVYGRVDGQDVIEHLHARPYAVIPVLLNRLKQKLEEWKTAQREWEKVWRDQTQKIFFKSLDHQAVNAKTADKRQFQTKTLLGEIQTKHEEQKRQRLHGASYAQVSRPQMVFSTVDADVVSDAACLTLIYADQYHSTDYPRLIGFIKDFIPIFFGYDVEWFNSEVRKKLGSDDLADEVTSNHEETTGPRRKVGGKKDDLRRGVLDRANRNDRGVETGAGGTPSSRATTPDRTSHVDEEMSEGADVSPDEASEGAHETWADYPLGVNPFRNKDVALNEAQRRSTFSLYGNASIYCFIRMFVILYERLSRLKESEAEVRETVRRALMIKPAIDLGLVDKQPSDFFENVGPDANYYVQVLGMIKDFIQNNDVELTQIEETLRRYYLSYGWQLYSIDKLLSALVRFAIGILASDSRDKSWELLALFKKDRVKEESTIQEDMNYRRQADRLIREGDAYKINYDQDRREISMKIFKHDEPTFDATRMQQEDAWRVYVHEYVSTAPTPGTQLAAVASPIMKRGLREMQNEALVQQQASSQDTAGATAATAVEVSGQGTGGAEDLATNKTNGEPHEASTTTQQQQQQQQAAGQGAGRMDCGGGVGGEDALSLLLGRRVDLVRAKENLEFKVAVGDYKVQFVSGQDEYWHQPGGVRAGGRGGLEAARRAARVRAKSVGAKFVGENAATVAIGDSARPTGATEPGEPRVGVWEELVSETVDGGGEAMEED